MRRSTRTIRDCAAKLATCAATCALVIIGCAPAPTQVSAPLQPPSAAPDCLQRAKDALRLHQDGRYAALAAYTYPEELVRRGGLEQFVAGSTRSTQSQTQAGVPLLSNVFEVIQVLSEPGRTFTVLRRVSLLQTERGQLEVTGGMVGISVAGSPCTFIDGYDLATTAYALVPELPAALRLPNQTRRYL
jgi:hypothetical protein